MHNQLSCVRLGGVPSLAQTGHLRRWWARHVTCVPACVQGAPPTQIAHRTSFVDVIWLQMVHLFVRIATSAHMARDLSKTKLSPTPTMPNVRQSADYKVLIPRWTLQVNTESSRFGFLRAAAAAAGILARGWTHNSSMRKPDSPSRYSCLCGCTLHPFCGACSGFAASNAC
jgi:hypothetical protein